MPSWWTLLFGGHSDTEPPRVCAQVTLPTTADHFLRRSLNDCRPDEAALLKARALLERALTPQQRGDLRANGHFYVNGKKFIYRIREGHAGNVDALDFSGRLVNRFCGHPVGLLPVYDVMLAQKLWIETDENMFLKKAAPYPRF